MAEEEQGAEEAGEDVRCNAVKRFPDGVRDGVRPRGGKGLALVRAAEISSAVRAVQSAKGPRMEGRGRGGCGGKK